MKGILAYILALLALISFMNPIHARVLDHNGKESSEINCQESGRYEEGIIAVNIPIELIRAELRLALLSEDSPIKEISRLDFDPIKRLIMIEGTALLPDDIITDLASTVEQDEKHIEKEHRFTITASFGDSEKLAKTRFFTIEFLEFKLDEQDYISAFPIIGNFLSVVLANTGLVDYVLGVNEAVTPGEKESLIKVRDFMQSGIISFNGSTVRVKLDLKKFYYTERFASLADLRLWQFRPVLLMGTKDRLAFRIEAGLGKPGDCWVKGHKDRVAYESKALHLVREQFYNKYKDIQPLMDELLSFRDKVQKQFGLEKVNDESELDELHQRLYSRARDTFSLQNALFEADPQREYDDFKREAKEYIVARISDLKRRIMIEKRVMSGGSNTSTMPFLTKWLSQDALNQGVRFFRSIKDESVGQLFPEFHMIMDPKKNGFTIRGRINMDLRDLLEIGLEDTGVEVGDVPIYTALDMYGKAIPFEMNLRTVMGDDSWLGLDASSVSLFDGSLKTVIKNEGKHGEFVINFIKMAITQTLATTLIEQSPEEKPEDVAAKEEKSFKELLRNIQEQANAYHENEDNNEEDDLAFLLSLAKIDIEKNPFLTTGEEFVRGKTELFFKELIKYDHDEKLIEFRLDPRIASDSILSSKNTVQVWNLQPIFSKKLNNVFLELTLGNKKRSKRYLDFLDKRVEKSDGKQFAGVDFSNQSPLDLRAKLDLKEFTALINQILADAFKKQNKEAEAILALDQESEHYLIKDLRLEATKSGSFQMFTTLTHLQKSERWRINPARWFGSKYGAVKKKTIFLKGIVALKVEKLEKYMDGLKLAENEVFFGDEVLAVNLENVGYVVKGDKSLIDRLVMLVGKDLNLKSGLGSKLKGFLINALSGIVHSTDPKKNGNIELNGIKINKYAKILSHKREILIQLNSHMMGAAFDVRLLANQKFNGENLGLNLSHQSNEITFDFHTAANMASVDKYDLYRVMIDAVERLKPILEDEDMDNFKHTLETSTFYDDIIRRSDKTRTSPYKKYLQVMREYSGLLDLREVDSLQLDTIRAAQGNNYTDKPKLQGNKKLTTTGVEVIYFLSSGLVFYDQLDRLIKKIDDHGMQKNFPYYKDLLKKRDSIMEMFLKPFYVEYMTNYLSNNRKVSKKGITDWNHTYYPDARYSDLVFKRIERLLKDKLTK